MRSRNLNHLLCQVQQRFTQFWRVMNDEREVERHQISCHVVQVFVLTLKQDPCWRGRELAIGRRNLLLHGIQRCLKLHFNVPAGCFLGILPQHIMENIGAYNKLQSTQPQTLAHALADSPVGQLAWSSQLFGDAVSDDYILTNVMIYWLTNTAASSARFYYEDAHARDVPTEPTTVPLGLANFANDFQSIRPFAERDHKNIVSWNVYDRGSHHATEDAPDLLVADIRKFFRPLSLRSKASGSSVS